MIMISLSTALKHYKRKDVQDEIILAAQDKEVVARFGDKGFGKRPDILKYPTDIIEQVKNGATSFHVSEERWKNPLQLTTPMSKKHADNLRTGWDLVIDIDFEVWEITKIIAQEIVNALKEHKISSISCKFSGNKGFHIGVPFEAFPEKVHNNETRLLFPESTKRILSYLTDYVDSTERGFSLSKKIIKSKEFNEFIKKSGKSYDGAIEDVCIKCGAPLKKKKDNLIEFMCKKCGNIVVIDKPKKFMICDKCGFPMDNMSKYDKLSENKCKCGGKNFTKKVNLFVDAILISPRHLYRMAYSLHEKSGLVSIPIDPDKILGFEKSAAKPETLRITKFKFLDRKNVKKGEAGKLIMQAFDYKPQIEAEESEFEKKEYKPLGFALQEEFFPPCIKKGLNGLKDGRKRFSFILINFLTSVGWDYDKIEKLLTEWNKKNYEPLREVNLSGQLKYHKRNKKKILPPNCDNAAYYKDIGICNPDSLCKRIKNPVNYSRLKVRSSKKSR